MTEITERELEPCPFDDGHHHEPVPSASFIGTAAELEAAEDQWEYRVRCACGASGPARDSEAEAIAAWNRRAKASPPSPAEPRAELSGNPGELVEEVREVVERLNAYIASKDYDPEILEGHLISQAARLLSSLGKGVEPVRELVAARNFILQLVGALRGPFPRELVVAASLGFGDSLIERAEAFAQSLPVDPAPQHKGVDRG